MAKTLRRKMTMRDFVIVKYLCEVDNGKPSDLDDILATKDKKELANIETRYIRVPEKREAAVIDYLEGISGQQSYSSLLDTIKDATKPIQPKPVLIQQVATAPMETAASAATGDPYSAPPSTPPIPTVEETVEYPVYTDVERWELAEALEREPDENVVDNLNYKITDKSIYYFIKNPNKPVNSLENFEPMLALKMIFDGKVTPLEVSKVCGAEGSFIFSMNSREMPNLHPDFVQKYIQFTPACMDMWELGKQYRYMMKCGDENIDEKENLHRYALVMRRELEPIKEKEIKDLSNQFIEKIIAVRGDTITLSSNDDDVEEQDIVDIKYDNADDLKNDFMILAGNYDFDPKKQVDIFGKTTTYEKVTKEFMKKYPHAISGKFFRTNKEAFIEGGDKIGGVIGADFQWRVER